MERLDKYRQYVRQLLTAQAEFDQNSSDVECQLLFDVEHDHYQLLDVGWDRLKRVYHCYIHLDIKDGKVWIQRNMTEIDIAAELVEMDVYKEDIVLGLHPPYKRPYTGYGVA
ncbi:MAG: XisI protein [Phormidesmis sp. CAN_BIN44]|nr:XisI protein [Phormidesmis sp. CAN_BIN44]